MFSISSLHLSQLGPSNTRGGGGGGERKSARASGRVREALLKIPNSLKLTFMRGGCDRVTEKRKTCRRKKERWNCTEKVMVRMRNANTVPALPSCFLISFSPSVPYQCPFPYWKPCPPFISRACWPRRHWPRDRAIEAERKREWWWEYRFPSVGLLCSRASGVWDWGWEWARQEGERLCWRGEAGMEGGGSGCEGEGVQRGSWIPPGLSTEEHVWLSSSTLTRTDSLACKGAALPPSTAQPQP